jgi:hypothetical protein
MSFVCFARFNIFLLNIHVREREELDTSPLSFEFSKSFFYKFEVLWGICCVFSWGKTLFGFKRSHHHQYHLSYHQVLFCFGLFGLFSYHRSKNQNCHPCSEYLFKAPESDPGVNAFLKLKSLM